MIVKKNKVINTEKLEQVCKEFIEFLESDDFCEDEIENYSNEIFEKGLEAIYGKNIWDYVNSKADE